LISVGLVKSVTLARPDASAGGMGEIGIGEGFRRLGVLGK
jgi:hypothetical protein